MTSWYSISVTVAPDVVEAIEHAFNSLEALGTEINHLNKKNIESVTVIGYFNELPDDEWVQDELHYALRAYDFDESTVMQLERNIVEQTDWLAEWKKHWRPSDVGGFVIAPPWSEVDAPDKIVIRIDPNMAFGTGTHETTQLCLRAIENNYVLGDTFLDVGTGTGILAIAAAKLNLKSQISNLKLLGVDTDVDSIAIARDNAALNGVSDSIEFSIGTLSADTPVHDFVCANLTLDVIEHLLPGLIDKAGKTLVLSGVLVEQEGQIISALTKLGVRNVDVERAGEWIALVVRR